MLNLTNGTIRLSLDEQGRLTALENLKTGKGNVIDRPAHLFRAVLKTGEDWEDVAFAKDAELTVRAQGEEAVPARADSRHVFKQALGHSHGRGDPPLAGPQGAVVVVLAGDMIPELAVAALVCVIDINDRARLQPVGRRARVQKPLDDGAGAHGYRIAHQRKPNGLIRRRAAGAEQEHQQNRKGSSDFHLQKNTSASRY